ncbi:MAG TPA: signal peptidase I [Hyphomicrobiaceae bacterium]|nr:signal peptidase I [Hyphomicrobiaceae bacterium]
MRIGSASMQPTLQTGETVLVDTSYYRHHQPRRGDLVIYRLPNGGSALFIKRVIAVAGERILVRRGRAIVNGRQVAEPYADFGDPTWAFNNTRLFVVPRGHLFVLGDNRANSRDSRVAAHGFVSIAALVGRATRIIMSPELARLGQWVGTPSAAAQPSF